jgi:hypothetical protein
MLKPNSMNVPKPFIGKLDQIEENLKHAVSEFPGPSALDRLKFALALIQFIRTQVALDADATAPSGRASGSHTDQHDTKA